MWKFSFFLLGRIYYWYQTNDTLRKSHQLREGAEFEFLDNRSKIQIHKGGLYLVYAQVCFFIKGNAFSSDTFLTGNWRLFEKLIYCLNSQTLSSLEVFDMGQK